MSRLIFTFVVALSLVASVGQAAPLFAGLGDPNNVVVNAVSPDGSTVVGTFDNAAGDREAFLWDAANGMRRLVDVLTDDYGLDLTGWTLDSVTAISLDGSTIVGEGINPDGRRESFVATGVAPGGGGSGSSGSGADPVSPISAIPLPGIALLAALFLTAAVPRSARRFPRRPRIPERSP